MENKTASALVLATILYAASLHAETDPPLTQSSIGNQSPVIKANVATFNYGLNETRLNALLEQHEDRLIKKMLAASGDEQERRLLEEQLKTVQEQKANLKKALEEEIQRRKNADKALKKLHGQLSPARLAKAGKLLQEGDTTAAELVFDEVVDKEGKAVAMAAYQNGQLAEGRLDYTKAMSLYKKAVALEEDNPDYLLAAGIMGRTMADYDQAQEWLERLLRIKQKEEDLDLCTILNELATIYQIRGLYNEAEGLYQHELTIKEKEFGKKHPDVAKSLKKLAALYETQARYEDAESLYKRVQEIVGKPSERITPTKPLPSSGGGIEDIINEQVQAAISVAVKSSDSTVENCTTISNSGIIFSNTGIHHMAIEDSTIKNGSTVINGSTRIGNSGISIGEHHMEIDDSTIKNNSTVINGSTSVGTSGINIDESSIGGGIIE